MVVQHNLTAMNSNRMLGLTTSAQAKSTEKLSSGYKINRAADDAAGLSISEKMRKQIRGLSQASLNAQDGISAVQTAEGALTEVHDMLQRMNELAVKAANGTNSEDDRSYIQAEVDQLIEEIDRVAETTKFNETYLLKGVEGKSTVETPATTTVSYQESITGELLLNWAGDGKDTLYATKDGVSEEITADNYADFFEIGKKEIVAEAEVTENTKLLKADGTTEVTADDLADVLNAGEKVYTSAAEVSCSNNGVAVAIKADATVPTADVTYTYNADGKWVDTDGNELDTNVFDVTGTAAEGNTITFTAAVEAVEDTDYSVTREEVDAVVVKVGYGIYTEEANEDDEYGDQKIENRATDAQIEELFTISSDLLLDEDGNTVEADKLADYFDEAGKYLGGLYKYDTVQGDTLTEVGAEQIDNYVEWTRTDAESQEVDTVEALTLSLHVGADGYGNNKISVDIKSMSAKGIGVDGLKVDTEAAATESIETLKAAIQAVSEQRSALGAIQNRLEHTINNLDNIVENTTAAESQIRDTDMATEMVSYSNNNILAQAGQAMLAQANQSNQGVLSLLG